MGRRQRKHSVETKKSAVADFYRGVRVAEICANYEISSGLFYYWKRLFDRGILNGHPNKQAQLEKRVAELERMVGKLTMENEALKKREEFFEELARKKESLLTSSLPKDGQFGERAK